MLVSNAKLSGGETMIGFYTLDAMRKAIKAADAVFVSAPICDDRFPVQISKAAGLRLVRQMEQYGVIMPSAEKDRPLGYTDDEGSVFIG